MRRVIVIKGHRRVNSVRDCADSDLILRSIADNAPVRELDRFTRVRVARLLLKRFPDDRA